MAPATPPGAVSTTSFSAPALLQSRLTSTCTASPLRHTPRNLVPSTGVSTSLHLELTSLQRGSFSPAHRGPTADRQASRCARDVWSPQGGGGHLPSSIFGSPALVHLTSTPQGVPPRPAGPPSPWATTFLRDLSPPRVSVASHAESDRPPTSCPASAAALRVQGAPPLFCA